MKVIDSHAHIYLPELENDHLAIIQRAENESVAQILMPAVDSSTHKSMIDMAERYPSKCLSMMGVHPCSIKENYEQELRIAQYYWEKSKFIAVGEIGLDFYWDLSFREQQYKAFEMQIEWALLKDVPIVIHSRESIDECINVVKNYQDGRLRGVFHCFSGNSSQAKQAIDLGFYLGIGGVVTFKNSGLDKVISEIGLEKLLLETDAPYLAPVPFRGKRNEPSYLKYVIDKLSTISNHSPEEIAAITTANTEKLFRLV